MNKRWGVCARTQRRLSWLLAEGEGQLPTSGTIADHIKKCHRCRAEAARLLVLLGSLGSDPIPDPGEAYWQAFSPRLRNRLAAEGMTGRTRVGWAWALAATAASFLLVGVCLGRWKAPAEARARMSLEQVARESDPETLQRALDTLLPEPDPVATPAGGNDAGARAAELQRTLDDVLPNYDTGAFGAVGNSAAEEPREYAQDQGPGWV